MEILLTCIDLVPEEGRCSESCFWAFSPPCQSEAMAQEI